MVSVRFVHNTIFRRVEKVLFLGAMGLGSTKFSTIRRSAKNEVALS